MRIWVVLVALVVVCVAVVPAVAQDDLYDNGPTNGTVDAWTGNFGFVVSDTFTLRSDSQVNGLTFAAWLFPGDVLYEGEVAITSSEFGGTTYFDGIVLFTQTDCVTNQIGFNVCSESASFGPVNLDAGTYWLTLSNLTAVEFDDPVYWDENSGPSQASQSSVGTIPSESFTILGSATSTTSTTGTTPEPSSILLLGSGVLSLAGIVRRNLV